MLVMVVLILKTSVGSNINSAAINTMFFVFFESPNSFMLQKKLSQQSFLSFSYFPLIIPLTRSSFQSFLIPLTFSMIIFFTIEKREKFIEKKFFIFSSSHEKTRN